VSHHTGKKRKDGGEGEHGAAQNYAQEKGRKGQDGKKGKE